MSISKSNPDVGHAPAGNCVGVIGAVQFDKNGAIVGPFRTRRITTARVPATVTLAAPSAPRR